MQGCAPQRAFNVKQLGICFCFRVFGGASDRKTAVSRGGLSRWVNKDKVNTQGTPGVRSALPIKSKILSSIMGPTLITPSVLMTAAATLLSKQFSLSISKLCTCENVAPGTPSRWRTVRAWGRYSTQTSLGVFNVWTVQAPVRERRGQHLYSTSRPPTKNWGGKMGKTDTSHANHPIQG